MKTFNTNDILNDNTALTVFELAYNAIIKHQTIQFLDETKDIAKIFEKTSNKLNLDESNNKACYLFGRITSLYELIMVINKSIEEHKNHIDLINNYPLLIQILSEIYKHGTINGVQLRSILSIKSNSLSNFFHRIKKYELVSIRKYKNTNFYSLTINGINLYKLYLHMNNNSV